MDEEEALALVVQKRERMTELQTRSVDAKKKQINDAIAVIRAFCIEHESCIDCPLSQYEIDEGGYYCDFPSNWEEID